ncbi:MAG: CBS domain-containing protein [Hyphomicrobiaceae bacterium]
MKVADILAAKGNEVMSVRPSETILTFAHRLRMARVGAMIVSGDGRKILGIISERDVTYGFATHGLDLAEMHVSDLMNTGVVTCSPSDTIAEIAKIMTRRRIRHLPVQENDNAIGIVSIGDIVKHRLDEMELEANVLRDYAIARS